jgi:CRISPR-associated protein Csb2
MAQYLCMAATFLAGRYHGREWPPSPARLFQALLAGSRTGLYRQHWSTLEPALRELERLPAPQILASNSRLTCPYRIAVPNNDSDKVGREWGAGRPFELSSIRTLKTVIPRELQVAAGEPHIYYIWELAKPLGSEPFHRLGSFLHTLGWGIDMAYADSFIMSEMERQTLISKCGYSHYRPAEKGSLSNVPAPGYLEDLTKSYAEWCGRQTRSGVDPSIRATKYGQQRYQRSGSLEHPSTSFLLRQLNDSERWYAVPWSLGMKVAAWMRHAAATALREEGYPDEFVNSYVLGHGDGHDRHMSFAPVPTIRSMHADGSVRRVMLIEPFDADGSVTRLLQWKLAPSELIGLVNGGPPKAVCSLAAAPDGDLVLNRYNDASTLWHSVTPVVLHGHNSERKRFSLKKTEQLLYQAFEKSGHSRHSISELTFQPAPFWTGTEGALTMRVPEHLRKWPRYHVAVRFREAVRGPVLVGIGRHYGIGLFAAPQG